jgi:hypothetical protein
MEYEYDHRGLEQRLLTDEETLATVGDVSQESPPDHRAE